ADGQFVALVDFQRTGHAPAVAGLAEHDAAAGFVATAVGRGVALELDGDAVDLPPGDDVHHAGDRVGAVDRGRTVLQDFDVVDRHVGQDVEVRRTDRTARARRRHAATVEQQQGAGGAQAA